MRVDDTKETEVWIHRNSASGDQDAPMKAFCWRIDVIDSRSFTMTASTQTPPYSTQVTCDRTGHARPEGSASLAVLLARACSFP